VTKKKDVVWFALDDSRPLFAFAGIWTVFKGERGLLIQEGMSFCNSWLSSCIE